MNPILKYFAIPTGVGAAAGGGLGYLLPVKGKTDAAKKKQRKLNTIALAIQGGLLGGMGGAAIHDIKQQAKRVAEHSKRTRQREQNYNYNAEDVWDDFFGGKGTGGGGHRAYTPPMPSASARVADIAKKYGVPANPASKAELNKAFRKASFKHHPDRGGSTQNMQDLSEWHNFWKNKVARIIFSSFLDEMEKIGTQINSR